MDFVKISYTAKVKDGGVFDTTIEDVAKKEKIFDSKRIYKPLPVIVGEKHVVEGLDEALEGMKKCEEKKVEVPPEKAFGQRNPALIRLVPLKLFKQQKMTPIPGMPVEIDGRMARVQTVAGGRVRVDFNHELAGRTVVYDIKVEEEAKTDKEKAAYLVERSFNDSQDFEIKVAGKKLELTVPEKAYHDKNLLVRKASFAAEAFKYLKMDEILYTEVWKNPEEKKKDSKPEKKAVEKKEDSKKE